MRPRRALVDSAVFLYALGGDHPLKQPCRDLISNREWAFYASTEMVQEVVFHRMRVGTDRLTAVAQAQWVAASCHLLPFDQTVLAVALQLISDHQIGGRDAVHAASAIASGLDEILSPDQDFDAIPGLTRLDPRALADG